MASLSTDPKAVFVAALERDAPEDRVRFLDQACGNDRALRSRVEELLQAHEAAGGFLAGGQDHSPTVCTAQVEQLGAVIGPYKLLEQIGEGGMGVVFMAQQQEPVRRRVALKIIKPGMDTRQVIARFEAERQALALMDHPNIAKVHDAGATENGRPYFVMELVQGVPITEYCDQCNLETGERLELFISVCQAVQHAHQKGIIHRDIKPTNVLVAIQDGRPAPKIIDFGVAKAINQQLTEHTLMTAFAQIVGTPLYMSPEQAELSPLGVDTRSDIYSLGALLYELLTGTTPFDRQRLHAVPYDEFRRIIREEEPPRPSARISTLAADFANTVAENRRTDARRLRQTVRGELDWIVMKCLEKDRNRRYESAGGLARDIERYLHDEPVQACPPSVAYRLKKFIRRNKIAAAFILLLVAAVAALSVSNVQTRRSERRATTENAKAQAISELLQGMLRSANPDEAKDADYTVRQMLDDFSAGFGVGLTDQPEVESEIRATIGRAYWRLGAPEKAEPHLTRALELRRDDVGHDHEKVAEVLVDMAWCRNEQGRLAEAADVARDALRIYKRNGTTGSPVFKASAVLQRNLISLRRFPDAQAVAEEALALAQASGAESPEIAVILHGHADLLVQLGRYPEAENFARKSVDIHRRLNGPTHPETAWGIRALGGALEKQQKLAEAETELRKALDIFRQRYRGEHHSLLGALRHLKRVLEARGDRAGLDALDTEERQRRIESDHPGYHVGLARLLLADNPQAGAASDVAHNLIRRATEEFGQVAVDFPGDLDRRLEAALGFVEIATNCAAHADFAHEIHEAHRRLMVELSRLLAGFPESPRCQENVGHRYRLWAYAVLQNGNYLSQVEQAHREAINLFEKLSRDNPEKTTLWYCLATSYSGLGDALWRLDRPKDAEPAFRRAIEIFDDHAAEFATDFAPDRILEITQEYARIAYFLAAFHKEVEAAEIVRKAIVSAQRLTRPNDSAEALYCVAVVQARLQDQAGYRATCKALLDLPFDQLEGFVKSRPIWTPCLAPDALDDRSLPVKRGEEFAANNSVAQRRSRVYVLGAALYRSGQYERAAQQLEEFIAAYSSSLPAATDSINYSRLFLAMTKWQLGQKDEARRLLADTQPAVEKELQSPSSGWNRRATLEVLRREAEGLIGKGKTDKAAKK